MIGGSFRSINISQRIPMGQSKMENQEKMAIQGTQDEETTTNMNTICAGHHYAQTSTNNVNKT